MRPSASGPEGSIEVDADPATDRDVALKLTEWYDEAKSHSSAVGPSDRSRDIAEHWPIRRPSTSRPAAVSP